MAAWKRSKLAVQRVHCPLGCSISEKRAQKRRPRWMSSGNIVKIYSRYCLSRTVGLLEPLAKVRTGIVPKSTFCAGNPSRRPPKSRITVLAYAPCWVQFMSCILFCRVEIVTGLSAQSFVVLPQKRPPPIESIFAILSDSLVPADMFVGWRSIEVQFKERELDLC